MNRSTMRTLLAKRLQDNAEDQFSTSDLNSLLNLGLGLLQADVMAVRPDAFVEISTFSIVASQDRYVNPEGWLLDIMIEVVDTAEASGYRKLSPVPFQQKFTDGDSITHYSHMGRFLVLSPTPDVAVSDGIRRTWVPTLTMDDDADIPEIKAVLHSCIVDYAVIEAIGETDEAGDSTYKRLQRKLERVSDIYGRVTAGQLYSLVPNVAR